MHSPRRFTRSAAGKSRRLDIAAAAIATALALAACRSSEPGSGGKPSETRASALAAVPANATAILAALRARPGSPVQAGVAQGFDAVAGGLRPQFAASDTAAEPALARVTLPQLGTGAVHLEDAQTGTAVDVSLRGALAAAAQSSDGYVVYPSALASGATVLERALPSGTEDFVNFDTRPATPAIAYDLALGAGVSGLRLVAGTLEMLDAGGAPRLRVSPPYVVGADGARTEAVLAVAGCAFDSSPAAPWGRPVTAPGAKTCTVNVTWPDQAVVYPAVLDPRWTTTGSMATAREDHTATLLSTGKVLVTGGRSSNTGTTGLATAELYDKTSGTWGAAASMSAGRFLHRATQLNTGSNPTTSGKVLISGGINGTTSLSTFQLYDPTAGTWGTAGNLNAPRHGHVATVLADGKVLVSGGLNGTTTLATAAIYNPASGSGSWAATTGPLPPSGQKNHTGVLLVTSNQQLNNKVLLVGGNSGSATLSAVYLFDPAQSAFSTLASIPTPREQHTMTVLADGKVLVTGGKNGSTVLNTAVVFDPGFGPGSWSSAGTMTAARFGHTATLLPASIVANGQVLVAGGSNGTSTLASAELFSGTSTWTTTPAMPAPAQGHTATMLGNNMVLVAGGLNGTTVLNAARLYDASFGLGCTSNSQCPTGFCANGVCCDTACTGTCGACNLATTLGTCSPLANGTVCRAAASGGCDVAETCNGTALTCPTDGFKSSTTSCRAAAGDCDLVENCTGSSATCPADVKKGNGTACNDGNACTQTDTCQAGACTGSNPITCVAQDQCHTAGTCAPATGCSNPAKANGVACNDGNACTQTDTCQTGTCTGANPVVCTAQDQCHVAGTCASGTGICSNPSKANGTTCNDGNLCTQTDTCQSGSCTGGSPVVCTAQDQCHVAGTCASGTGICSNPSKANGTTCNDGNLCTQTDTCQSGSCTGGNPVVCTAQDQCHVAGTCASGTGVCSNPSKANGTTCNDGNLCTQTDTCQSGSCTGANPVVCTAQDQCHVVGSCASGTGICSNPSKADGSSCSDGNSCTSGDACLAGSCNPGSQSCTSIVIAETRGSDNLTPQMTITLGANVTTAVPGDPVEMTAVVTNTGAIVDFFQGHFTIHNTGSTTFVVAGYQQTLERFSVSQQAWVPFAKLAVDAAGNPIPDPDIFALHWDFANSVPATGVTYSANVVGTSIAPDATADWVYRLWPTLPGDIIAKMFDPAQTSGLRMALHFDVPSGPPPAPAVADLADAFPGVTGAIEDPAVLVRFDGLGLVDPVGSLLMPSIPGPIAPGVARTFFGVVAALAMPARDPNGSDPSLGGGTDGQYLGMLAGHILSGYDPGAFVSGHALLTSPGDTFIRTHVAIQLPVVTPQKSGPSQSNAGLTLPYAVALPNSGNAVAGPFSLTDSVDGAAIPGATVTTPPTVAGGQSGIATVAAPTPLTRPAGAMTDVVAVSWHDKNGTVYGPVASSFTTTLGAGHPEGYLSLGGETTYPDLLNTPKTLTAKALDPFGNPVAGVTVNFAVSGVNAQTANPVTDAAGNATFAYAGTHLGNDTIVASATITTTVVTATVHAQWASSVDTPPCTGRATPRDVMFVIDGSPSMFDPSNVNAAKAASDTLIDDLDFSRDQVAAVLFSGAANLEVPLTANAASAKAGIDASLEAYAHACDGFCAGGSNYAQALNIALAELQGPRHRAAASPLVIFLSDGGNTGVDPTPQITQLHDLGIRTLSVGLGPDVVVSMMRKIATSANDYFYAPTTSGLAWVYGNLEEDACRTNPPLVSAGGDQGLYDVRLPDILTLQGEAHGSGPQGDKRLTSAWTQVSGPAPASFTDASSPVTQVLFTAPGTYVFQLAVSDGFLTVADRATITVDPDPSIVGANLVVALGSPGPLTTGTAETVTATLTDGQGAAIRNFVIRFTVAGANAATATVVTNTAGVAVFAYQGMKPGTDAVHATAFGTTLQLDSATVSVNWTEPTTGGPILTQGWIASPAHQATVMGQIPVVLSPTVTLTGGTLTYWPTSAPGQVHTLNPSTTGAPGATLGTLDTTMLANGTYILKLDGTDNAGDQKVSEVAVIVSGDYKPGRLLVEVTDFTIPLAGLPITVGRRYDSLEKDNEGDFGHGWSLMIGHPKLEVDPGHNVTMTLPNGRRDTFYFGGTSFPFPFSYLFAPKFFPAPGVFGKLTSDGCEITIVNGGQLLCFEQSTLDFAPTTYTYTDPYGREFVMAASGELKSIKDLQGNTLSFEPNGIISSAGKTVTFEREQGRITKVISPAVGGTRIEWHYGYDLATGDLTTVNLPPANNSAVVQYTYDQHRLLKTVDPNNHPARTSTYYPDGRLHTDKDAMLNLTSYEYDLPTRTTRTTNPDTGLVTQVFDDRGLLLTETDPLGHTTTHTYDGDRNEKTRTNALNETMHFGYDTRGNQTSTRNERNETTSTTYNDFGQATTFTDQLHHLATIEYDERRVLTSFSDELGTRFTFTSSEQGLPLTVDDAGGHRAYLDYDGAGNLTSRTDWLSRVTKSTYDEIGRRVTETSPRGEVRTNHYNPRGTLDHSIELQDGESGRHRFEYDANDNILHDFILPFAPFPGRSTIYTYDALNRVQHVTYGDSHTRDYTYDFRGNKLTETDESGRTTKYEYDLTGRLKTTTFPGTTPTEHPFTFREYDELLRMKSLTDELGHTTTYEYETGCGCSERVTKVTDPLLHATITTYDAKGRRDSVTDPAGHRTEFLYDVRDHLTDTNYFDGTNVHDEYDPRGRRFSSRDQTAKTTFYGYDDQGQLTSVTDPLQHVTSYTYDPDGNLATVTDANNHTTLYDYDLLRRKTKRTLPLQGFETFLYDPVGNQTSHTDFRGKTTKMDYDARDRLLHKIPDPTLGEPTVTYTYFATGMRETMADGSGTTGYFYDERNRMTTKTTSAGTLTYTYDVAGNLKTIQSSNPNGTFVEYGWDEANQLTSVKDHSVLHNGNPTETTATYSPTGRPSTLSQPNGVAAAYAYNHPVDRLTSMEWQRGSAPAFASWAYTYNDRGQRLTATDATGRSAAYGYDDAARLLSETIAGDPRGAVGNGALTYGLDPAGNRLSRTSTLAALAAQTFSYDANDHLATDGYDPNGNTTGADGSTYAYDFENRLVSKNNGSVTIVYDGDGNRVAKTAGGVTTNYLVDDLNPTGYLQVMEEVSGGAVQTRYAFGSSLVSQTRDVSSAPATSYYGYDARGNVTFLTDVAGVVTDSYDYDAWGTVVAQIGSASNTRLYAGEELDPDLGLINLRDRHYDPNRGRFRSIDPAEGHPGDPVTFSPYVYAGSDPANRNDPSGRAFELAVFATALQRDFLFGDLGMYAHLGIKAATLSFGSGPIVGFLSSCAQRSFAFGVLYDAGAVATGSLTLGGFVGSALDIVCDAAAIMFTWPH